MTEGVLPRKTNLSESSFMMKQYAENDGGTDTLDVPVTIRDGVFLGAVRSVGRDRVVSIYDLRNNNQQLGGNIDVNDSDTQILMSGRRFVTYWSRGDNGGAGVFDFISGSSIGRLRFGRSTAYISRRYLVLQHYDSFRAYDLDNGLALVGETFFPSQISQFDSVTATALSGRLFAVSTNRSRRITLFDLANNNEKIGDPISLGGGRWAGLVILGSKIIALRSDTQDVIASRVHLIKIFDMDNANVQVGGDISLPTTRIWRVLVGSGTRVAMHDLRVVRVIDITTSQQVGSDITPGGTISQLFFQDPLLVVRQTSPSAIKVFDIDNSGQQVGSDINISSSSIALDSA